MSFSFANHIWSLFGRNHFEVVELPERVTVSAEAFVLGDYRKHNTNGGSTMGPRTTPQAFRRLDYTKIGSKLFKLCHFGYLRIQI